MSKDNLLTTLEFNAPPPENEKSEILFEGYVPKIYIRYFWDAHGKLFAWQVEGKTKTAKSGVLKYVKRSWEQFGREWQDITAYVDGVAIVGSLYEAKETTTGVSLKIAVGWG